MSQPPQDPTARQTPPSARRDQRQWWPVLSVLFSLMAVSYLVLTHEQPYPYQWLHKASPILLLIGAALVLAKNHKRLLSAALAFSALGDVLLALTFEQSFVAGLAAFLLAHLCYCAVFNSCKSDRWHWRPITLLLLAGLLGVGAVILMRAGPMTIPVAVYMLAIAAMCLLATQIQESRPLILSGAILFVISDSLIGINRFVTPVPWADYSIMLTYYLAQALLFFGITRHAPNAYTPNDFAA